jgi:hypothetical protein
MTDKRRCGILLVIVVVAVMITYPGTYIYIDKGSTRLNNSYQKTRTKYRYYCGDMLTCVASLELLYYLPMYKLEVVK